MTDDQLRRWLTDDPLVLNAILVVATTSFAVALVSCLRHHRADPHQQRPDDPPSVISTTLAFFHLSVVRTVPSKTQQSLVVSVPEAEQKDRKSTRSKERRRRGKDPFRDLFKGGKKSKVLLKAIKATDHDHSPLSADTLSNSSTLHNDTASSTSRSQSPEPTGDVLAMDCLATHLGVESDDGSVRSVTPNGNMSSTSVVTSAADTSEHGSSDAGSLTDGILVTTTDTEASISSVSTVIPHASEDASSCPPVSMVCVDVRTPQSRDSQAEYTSGSCAKLVRARTRLRLSRMDPNVKSSLLSSSPPPLPDSVATPSSIHSITPCPSLFITPSTPSVDGAGPSTPTKSRGSTPPPRSPPTFGDPCQREPNTQPLGESTASTHMQLASMHSALEAARLREEQSRLEAEQASKERDELRWGWSEEASIWRRREAELQAQIHHLMQQLQAYAAVASFQTQQASSAFSSPTSSHPHSPPRLQHPPLTPFPLPPPIQPQNSASAPAHVQALLASAPMFASHPPGFTAPSGGLYPGPGFAMSPLLWAGMGLCAPNRDARHGGRQTPDSSASGSLSRGRRQCRRAENARSPSDESSLGEWDGAEEGSGDEDAWEEEDIFRNNVLADAILKRPESIRGLGVGKRSCGRPPLTQGGGVERMDALKDPAMENPSFVPSLVDTPVGGP